MTELELALVVDALGAAHNDVLCLHLLHENAVRARHKAELGAVEDAGLRAAERCQVWILARNIRCIGLLDGTLCRRVKRHRPNLLLCCSRLDKVKIGRLRICFESSKYGRTLRQILVPELVRAKLG